jgi:hypothetical protein
MIIADTPHCRYYMLVVSEGGVDDCGRLHQNGLSRLPGVTRMEAGFAL